MFRDQIGNGFNQARAILPDDGHYKCALHDYLLRVGTNEIKAFI